MDIQDGNTEHIHLVRINLHIIVPARQTFPEAAQTNEGDGIEHRLFESLTETRRVCIKAYAASALKSEAAQKCFRAGSVMGVAITDHINAIGPVGPIDAGFAAQTFQLATRSATGNVVH